MLTEAEKKEAWSRIVKQVADAYRKAGDAAKLSCKCTDCAKWRYNQMREEALNVIRLRSQPGQEEG